MFFKQLITLSLLSVPALLHAQHDKKADTTIITVKMVHKGKADSLIVDNNGGYWLKVAKRRKNVETHWLSSFDFGFSNYTDNTDYNSTGIKALAPGIKDNWLDSKFGKSVNFSLWIMEQKVNLVQHAVNLKYGIVLELNNYRFKNPVRWNKSNATNTTPLITWDNTTNYSKTKLAADYVTVPFMLNFAFPQSKGYSGVSYKPRKGVELNAGKSRQFGFSVGMSAGYLYTARNKFVNDAAGKQKTKDDFGLRPWKISYIGEINLGYITLFGSYANKSMFKNGLDLTPYNVGIRF